MGETRRKSFILLFLYASEKKKEIPLEWLETSWVKMTINTTLQGFCLFLFFCVCMCVSLFDDFTVQVNNV